MDGDWTLFKSIAGDYLRSVENRFMIIKAQLDQVLLLFLGKLLSTVSLTLKDVKRCNNWEDEFPFWLWTEFVLETFLSNTTKDQKDFEA